MKLFDITKEGETTRVRGKVDIWTNIGYTVVEVGDESVSVPEVRPLTLSKTAFLDHAVAQLGSPSRLIDVLETARDHADADLRYAYRRYEAAQTLNKDVASEFLDKLLQAKIINQAERDDLVIDWPTA